MDLPTNSSSNAINEGSHEYPCPCHVNAAKLVSIKLSGKNNYAQWKEQMLSLMDDHNMLGFIDGTVSKPDFEPKYREWKRSDDLAKGWILCSITEDMMGTVVGYQTANQVWSSLKANHTRKKEVEEYVPLCRAIQEGDWNEAQKFFINDTDALTCMINHSGSRALHLAISNPTNIGFLENLLEQINPESLPGLVKNDQASVLHHAAILDNSLAAKKLVEKNPDLLFTVDGRNFLPVHIAAINSHKDTLLYLLKMSKRHVKLSQKKGCYNPFEGERGVFLVCDTILAGFLDVAYDLLKEHPDLATTKSDLPGPLWCLAKIPNIYRSAERYNFYQKFVYSHVPTENRLHHANENIDIENQENGRTNLVTKYTKSYVYPVTERIIDQLWKVLLQVPHIKHLHEDKAKHNLALLLLNITCNEVGKLKSDHWKHYIDTFVVAVNNNTPEVIKQITRSFPESIWVCDPNDYSLAQLSIINRCEKVYNFFVHEVTHDKHPHSIRPDGEKNNLLHLAGKLAPTHKLNLVTGAALRMQRELQWFQEVEKLMRPREREAQNIIGETPIMLFRKEHKDLRQEGEEWMKKTAESYTITAALIITIVFAAAITVPGGNSSDTGKPLYISKPSFIIFAISDAISLFTSTTSLLLFLSVLTARFAEEDFLYRLPMRLILGLVMLFISVTAMMIAFSATLYIMFGLEKSWVLIPIASLTCLPIVSFVTLQLPLLVDLIRSTYGSGIFAKEVC